MKKHLKLQLSSKCEIIAISKAVFHSSTSCVSFFHVWFPSFNAEFVALFIENPTPHVATWQDQTWQDLFEQNWCACIVVCFAVARVTQSLQQPHVNPQLSFVFTSCFPTQTQPNLLVHNKITNGTLLLREDFSGLVYKEGHTYLGHEKVWCVDLKVERTIVARHF